jgi:uncharacterized membrane protein YfcA
MTPMMAVLQTIGMAWLALFITCVLLAAAFRMASRGRSTNDGKATKRKRT